MLRHSLSTEAASAAARSANRERHALGAAAGFDELIEGGLVDGKT